MPDNRTVSKTNWLIAATIVFALGTVIWGGSALVVLFAAGLTLPAIQSKHSLESGLGVSLLLLCLMVSLSMFSNYIEQEYLKRTKILEVWRLLEQLKSPVESFYAAQHVCPTLQQIEVTTANRYVANILLSGSYEEKCIYTAVLNSKLSFAPNSTLGSAYFFKSNAWSCKNKDTATTSINPAYLPSLCRD